MVFLHLLSTYTLLQGEEAIKQRGVYCVDKITNKVIDDSECDALIKPISTIKCADVPAC